MNFTVCTHTTKNKIMQTDNDQPTSQPIGNKPGSANTPLITDDKVAEALKQAEHDIEEDPDFQEPGPTHDMDEGEIARYEAGDSPEETT